MSEDPKNRQAQLDTDRFVREVMQRITKTESQSLYAWNYEGETGSGYWASKPNINIDRYSLKSLLYEVDWVYILNNLVATKISNQRLIVVETEVVDGEKLVRPAMDHELQYLLDHPNERQSQTTLTYNWTIDLTLGGNGYILHLPNNDSMHNMPFECIQADFKDGSIEPTGYLFSRELDEGLGVEDQMFKADDILHSMKPNPSNPWYGLSPFIPGRSSILFNKYSSEFLNSFYLKGATPQLALEMDADVNEKSALRMLKSFEKAYTGRENQRRPLVTPKGVKVNPITTTLSDQQLITYINSNRETMINLLAIPKHELSIQDGGGLGSQEMRLSLRNFWLTTLKPTMRLMEGSLNRHFEERLGPNHEIMFDLSNVEALQDDEVKKAELSDRLIKAGVMTPNEVRQKVYKMDAHDDGDFLVGAQGRGLQEEPPPSIPDGERPSDGEPIRSLAALNPETKEAIAFMMKQREDEEEKPKGSMASLAVSLFQKYLDLLVGLMAERLPDVSEDDQEKKTKADETQNERRLRLARERAAKRARKLDRTLRGINTALVKELRTFRGEFGEQYSTINEKVFVAGRDNILQASFDQQQSQDIAALDTPENRRTLLKARGIKSFDTLNKATTEAVFKKIRNGFEANKSLTEMTRDIVQDFSKQSEARAQRVARTEVGMATMIGREAAWQDAKEVIGEKLSKVWITAGDGRVRDGSNGNGDHVSLNNTKANEQGIWVSGSGNDLRFPLDPAAVPEERINCRCDIIFVEDQ